MALAGQILDQFRKYNTGVALRNLLYNWFNREKHSSYGTLNQDKVFYVIRSLNDTSPLYIGTRHNLLANYFYTLSHLAYARERDWIPVVDQLNYPVYNSLPKPLGGTMNAWEYFWEQPSSYTLDEVYRSANVVLSKRSWYGQWDMGYETEKYYDEELVKLFSALSDTVPLNRAVKERCEQIREKYFIPDRKVLGVSVRVSGHSRRAYLQAPGHPIQADNEEMLGICMERLQEWGMDSIFLATDSEATVAAFRECFRDRLIVIPRQRCQIQLEGADDPLKPMYSPESIYQTSLDYLTEMELLAGCTALLGSISSGLRYAVVRNSARYEHMDILDFGRFRDNRYRDSRGKHG